MNMLDAAPVQFTAIMVERKIMAAPFRDISSRADEVYKLGGKLLVYSEKEKK